MFAWDLNRPLTYLPSWHPAKITSSFGWMQRIDPLPWSNNIKLKQTYRNFQKRRIQR